jgi:hypothetical protein
MSIRAIQWVWDHSAASGTDMVVLQFIANCANEEGENAWPSIETLAKKARVGVRAVQRSIKFLIKLGELEAEKNGGRNGTYMFRLPMNVKNDAKLASETTRFASNMTQVRVENDTQTVTEPSSNQKNKASSKKSLSPELQEYEISNRAIPIPEKLQTAAFLKKWELWVEYRKKVMKKPLTVNAATMQLRNLAGYDDPILEIDRAIEGGWQKFYPKDEVRGSPPRNPNRIEKLAL